VPVHRVAEVALPVAVTQNPTAKRGLSDFKQSSSVSITQMIAHSSTRFRGSRKELVGPLQARVPLWLESTVRLKKLPKPGSPPKLPSKAKDRAPGAKLCELLDQKPGPLRKAREGLDDSSRRAWLAGAPVELAHADPGTESTSAYSSASRIERPSLELETAAKLAKVALTASSRPTMGAPPVSIDLTKAASSCA